MQPSKYTQVVKYLELDEGDIYVLPDESQIRFAKSQLDTQCERLEELRSDTEELIKQEGKGSDQVKSMQAAIKQLERAIAADTALIESMESLPAQYGDKAKDYVFGMHRYSWHEKMLSKEEARRDNDETGTSYIDEEALVLSMLQKSIESWPTEIFGEITEENIGALPPGVLDAVYRKLVDRSEPSAARLAFLGAGRRRPDSGEPGRRGTDVV